MQMTLEKTYPLPVGPALAWTALQDIPNVARCVPGAEIVEQVDPTHYKGRVKMKIGPVSVAFKGNIEVREIADEARRLHVIGKGGDGKGSNATLDLVARIEEAGDAAALLGEATVTVNGQIVRLAGRMMKQVADRLLDQFAANLSAQLASAAEAAPAPATTQAERDREARRLRWRAVSDWFRRLLGRRPRA